MTSVPRLAKGCFLLAGCLLAAAPEAQAGRWSANAWLGAGALWSDNLYLDADGEDRTEGSALIGAAGVDLGWIGSGGRSLGLNYQGQYYGLAALDGDDQWLHKLQARLAWEGLRPWVFTLTDTLSVDQKDTSRTRSDINNLIQKNVVGASVAVGKQLTPAYRLSGELDGEWLTYLGEDEDAVDERSLRAGLRFSGKLNPSLNGGVLVQGVHMVRTSAPDEDDVLVNLGFGWQPGPQATVSGSVERRWVRNEEGDVRSYWLWEGRAQYSARGGSRTALYFSDTLDDNFEGITNENQTARIDYSIADHRGDSIDASLSYERRTYQQGERQEEVEWGPVVSARVVATDNSALYLHGSWKRVPVTDSTGDFVDDVYAASCAAVVVLARRFTVEAGYSYQQDTSDIASRSYDGQFAYVLGTVYWEPLKPRVIPSPTWIGAYTYGASN